MSDQPLPPSLPARIPVRRFDWKPYVRALVWMLTSAVFISFATLILVPRSQEIINDSGYIVNDNFGMLIAFGNAGRWTLVVAVISLFIVLFLAETTLKGAWSTRVRSWGCSAIAYVTILSTLMIFLAHTAILTALAPVTTSMLDDYRQLSAQVGVLDVIEGPEGTARAYGRFRLRASIEVNEFDSLDEEEKIALLERATMLIAHASNVVIRRQALSQAAIAYRSLDREHFEPDLDGYLKVPDLLAAAADLTGESFESPDAIWEWGLKNRHLPMKEQQQKLNQKLRGHDAYYGVTDNYRMLSELRWQVAKMWRKWLGRRNRGGGNECCIHDRYSVPE